MERPRAHWTNTLGVMYTNAVPIDLYRYVFVRVAGNITISGFFRDAYGNQLGSDWSATINDTPMTLLQLYQTAFPDAKDFPNGVGTDGAVTLAEGFVGRLVGGDAYYNASGKLDGTVGIAIAVAANLPVMASTDSLYLGRA